MSAARASSRAVSGRPAWRSDGGEIAIQERGIRRRLDRGPVGDAGVIPASGGRGTLGPADAVLHDAHPQGGDAFGELGDGAVGRQRALETRQGVFLACKVDEGEAAADQRRRIRAPGR